MDFLQAFFKLTPDGKRNKKYEVPDYYMKRQYPKSATRVSRQSGVEVKWCENERSWLGSLYEGREAVMKDSPDPDAMRAIMEGQGKGGKGQNKSPAAEAADQDNQEDRIWYTREIAFLDSKAPKTGRQFKGIKNNLPDFLGDFWTYFDASTRALEDVYLC